MLPPPAADEGSGFTFAGDPLPPGGATIGGRIGDGEADVVGDLVVPLWYGEDTGLLFLNPRASATDSDHEEVNIGLGWRSLITLKDFEAIVGANAYYDSRWTKNDLRWDQFGFGLEFLSEWVDARFNYYLPEDDKKLFDRTETSSTSSSSSSSSSSKIVDSGPIVASGNSITQSITTETTTKVTTRTTTTRFVFERFEAALEGWDAEIGVLLPYVDEFVEARLFLGYQDFDNPFGDDFEGVKARAEIRALPGVFLDAEWFENEELNGTDYYVGARVRVPFDLVNLANGRNPFEGSGEAFQRQQDRDLADRMTEQVIRDVKVQTTISEQILNEQETTSTTTSSTRSSKKETTSSNTILGNAIVVDSDNVSGTEDGTFENPFNTFEEGETELEGGTGQKHRGPR